MVIPKEGRDHIVPGNFRPILLLNTDIKILARILANRLEPVLPTIIHPDQTGFIAGREARDNCNRVIQLISNFKITSNYNKSKILPPIMFPGVWVQLQVSFFFIWCRTALKYMRIYLPAHCNQLYTCNYAPLHQSGPARLGTFSWIGQVSILKMNGLPRILFYLQIVPISLPRYFFSTLNIRSQIKEILNIDLPASPLELLLHVPSIPLSLYRKSLLPHLLNAARRLIPVFLGKKTDT